MIQCSTFQRETREGLDNTPDPRRRLAARTGARRFDSEVPYGLPHTFLSMTHMHARIR